MLISDWINVVLALLALAGVAVAIWAVLLSDRRAGQTLQVAREGSEVDRVGDVADRISDMLLATSELQAELLPFWGDSKPASSGDELKSVHAALEKIFTYRHLIQITVETLPGPAFDEQGRSTQSESESMREIYGTKITEAATWLQAAAKVMYFSVIHDDKDALWASPNARDLVFKALHNEYGYEKTISAALLGKAKNSVMALGENTNGPDAANNLLYNAKDQLAERLFDAARHTSARTNAARVLTAS